MIRKMKTLLVILLSAGTLQAQTVNTAKMDSLFQTLLNHNKAIGSIAMSQNGKIVYARAFGFADIAGKVQATPQTRYRIGSITKMFTATLTFQLIEKKKLTLATTLDKFYPTVPNAAQISIGDLLSHRSGIHNFTDADDYTSYNTKPKTKEEIVALIAKGGSDFTPNEKAAYSNSNYVLLGYIIEQLYSQSYKEILANQIVKKAGLKNTYYGDKINTTANEALSYHFTDSTWVLESETDMSIPGGAGAIVSTPTDLNLFIKALFDGKLVSLGNLEIMKTVKDDYGMGMFPVPFYDKAAYGHTGGIDGFSSFLFYFPKENMSLAYCSNGLNYNMNDILMGALNIYFNRPYVIPEFKTYNLKAEDLDKYTGTYASTQIPLKITLTKDVNVLFAQATGQSAFALSPSGPDQFKFEQANIEMDFEPAKNQFTLKQSGQTFLFTKEQ
jgi:D-alanyl-D-alanine carboxypeptidase